MPVHSELLQLVRCPRCRGTLSVIGDGGDGGLACDRCAVVYPVVDGIPQLLVEEGRPLPPQPPLGAAT